MINREFQELLKQFPNNMEVCAHVDSAAIYESNLRPKVVTIVENKYGMQLTEDLIPDDSNEFKIIGKKLVINETIPFWELNEGE